MSLFKNPVAAVLLSLAIIAGSTLLCVRIRFGEACNELTDTFFNGTGSEASIRNELKVIVASAEQIAAAADSYNIDATALLDSIAELKQPLSGDPDISVAAVYDCYEGFMRELDDVLATLESTALASEERNELSSAVSIIELAADTIDSSPYNFEVEQFLRRHYRFPVTLLAQPAGVDIPEAFE